MPTSSNLTGLPPQLQKMISMYLGALSEPEDPYADLLNELGPQVTQARGAAEQAHSAFTGLQNQPMPTTSPGTDALTELLGGLSQMLAPEMGGLEQARGARAGAEVNMREQRTKRLQTMEKHYDELADRADKLGNLELSLKMRAKAETYKAKQERERDALTLGSQAYQGEQSRANQLRITGIEQAGATERTKITQDAQTERALQRIPGLTKDPNTGELVAKRGITDRDFTGLVREAQKGLMAAKGNKAESVQQFKSVWSMVREQEAFNPAAYALRLRNVGKQTGMDWLTKLGAGKEKFTPVEVADNLVAQYQMPFKTPDDVDALINTMRQAGYSPKDAHTAVTALWNIYNGQ